MIVPLRCIRGDHAGGLVAVPMDRIDRWHVSTEGHARASYGTSVGELVDIDVDGCPPLVVSTFPDLVAMLTVVGHPLDDLDADDD